MIISAKSILFDFEKSFNKKDSDMRMRMSLSFKVRF